MRSFVFVRKSVSTQQELPYNKSMIIIITVLIVVWMLVIYNDKPYC